MKEYKIKINGNDYNVVIDEVEETSAKVEVNGTPYSVEFERSEAKPRKIVTVVNKAKAAPAAPVAPAQKVSAPAAAAGETVVIMEAMKMENNITAEFAGKVTAVNVAVGDQVQSGQAMVVLA